MSDTGKSFWDQFNERVGGIFGPAAPATPAVPPAGGGRKKKSKRTKCRKITRRKNKSCKTR